MKKKFATIARIIFFAPVLSLWENTCEGDQAFDLPTDRPKIVLELFTSQGCSSCPPADRILEQLAEDPDVVALSRPVQYWDKLGWKDTLATRENTDKQFAYANRWRKIGAYTPQLVIDGSEDVVGNQSATIRNRIDHLREHKSGIVVHSSKLPDGSIELSLAGNMMTRADVHLLSLRASTLVAIGQGENAARRVRYVNAVISEKKIGEWAGKPITFVVDAKDLHVVKSDRWAIVVQEPGPSQIWGANFIDGASFLQ